MPSPSTIKELILIDGHYYALVVEDSNGNLAYGMTPFYQTSTGIVSAPVDTGGNPIVSFASSGVLYAGIETVGTTAVQLPAQVGSEVQLQASPSNTGNISVGTSTVQSMILTPGTPFSIQVENLNLLYAIATVANQSLGWLVRS